MSRRAYSVLLLVIACSVAAAPATRPAAGGPDGRQLRLWVAGLMDQDGSVRQKSKEGLLSLKRSDLPALRAAVNDLRPLDERTVEELRDVVGHVYLTAEEYDKEESGFLGISMGGADVDRQVSDVVVDSRMPGFVGYQALQDGDTILDIEEAPLDQPARREAFIRTVMRLRRGQTVHLKVLRQGQVLHVPVTLGARPRERDDEINVAYEARVRAMRDERDRVAAEYWRREFAPLLEAADGRGKNDDAAGARAVN